jgi:hypothetical protein
VNRQDVERAIEEQLASRSKKVLNRNAMSALFGACADPVGALGKVFLGRSDAIEAERQRIAQGLILDLLCNIDAAISQAASESSKQGVSIEGLIETTVQSADSVVGVHISEGMSNVTLRPGTHIRTVVGSATNVTGLQVGGKPKGE